MNKGIYKKLLECQKEFTAIPKGKTNPFYKSKYADINDYLEIIKPILSKYGLLLLQPLINQGLKTIIIDTETGEKESSLITLPEMKDAQKQGAVITYFRRYSIQSFFALEAKDNDAQNTIYKPTPKTDKYQQAKEYILSLDKEGLKRFKTKVLQSKAFTQKQRIELADLCNAKIGYKK